MDIRPLFSSAIAPIPGWTQSGAHCPGGPDDGTRPATALKLGRLFPRGGTRSNIEPSARRAPASRAEKSQGPSTHARGATPRARVAGIPPIGRYPCRKTPP